MIVAGTGWVLKGLDGCYRDVPSTEQCYPLGRICAIDGTVPSVGKETPKDVSTEMCHQRYCAMCFNT